MEWISVKDQKPKTRQDILFNVSKSYAGGIYQGRYVEHYENEHMVNKEVFVSSNGGFYRIQMISHWMPLPEPPKE